MCGWDAFDVVFVIVAIVWLAVVPMIEAWRGDRSGK